MNRDNWLQQMIDLEQVVNRADNRIAVFAQRCDDVSRALDALPGCLHVSDQASLYVVAPSPRPDGWPDALRMQQLQTDEMRNEQGCLCCGMRSELNTFLGQLFMSLLARREPPVKAVLVVTQAIETSALEKALSHAPFLAQRYLFVGSVCS